MLSPLYLLGSDLDPFPLQRVLSLELPQMTGVLRFDDRFFAILIFQKFKINIVTSFP